MPSYGAFGAVIYTYRLALETVGHDGKFYHPVDTPEEAHEWLEYYKHKTQVNGFEKRPLYERAWFVPTGRT